MGTKILTLMLALIVVMSMTVYAGDAKYVGAAKCKTCHNADKNGAQFKKWSNEAHSKAYEVLKSESAAKKAKAAGIEDPLKSDNCLACHTTAHGKKNVDKSYKIEEGVGCESCHGPGSEYKKMSTMKEKDKAIAAGMIVADEKPVRIVIKRTLRDTKANLRLLKKNMLRLPIRYRQKMIAARNKKNIFVPVYPQERKMIRNTKTALLGGFFFAKTLAYLE